MTTKQKNREVSPSFPWNWWEGSWKLMFPVMNREFSSKDMMWMVLGQFAYPCWHRDLSCAKLCPWFMLRRKAPGFEGSHHLMIWNPHEPSRTTGFTYILRCSYTISHLGVGGLSIGGGVQHPWKASACWGEFRWQSFRTWPFFHLEGTAWSHWQQRNFHCQVGGRVVI